MACLCAPTTHEGSFRCRLHRGSNLSNSSANFQKGVLCSSNLISDLSCASITARESPSASAQGHPVDDDPPHFSFHAESTPQVAADHRSSFRARSSTSSSSTSPLPSFHCTRPPPAKRPSSSSSSPSKSPYPGSSSPPTPSWYCASSSGTSCPSASHAAALAIMMQHLHNKHGRNHNRNTLRSSADSKIGPSRLSRMAVACAEELPLLKEDDCISHSPQQSHAPADMSGSFADASAEARGFGSFQATQISLKTRSSVNKFKQSETSCRIVGSKGGCLIMPTVY